MSGNKPLQFLGVGNLLERGYRNSPAYQWGRESPGTASRQRQPSSASAWSGKASRRPIPRLQYADDGHGMTKNQLRDYMSTLGKGGRSSAGRTTTTRSAAA